jgi:CSLREA domain-containing protein
MQRISLLYILSICTALFAIAQAVTLIPTRADVRNVAAAHNPKPSAQSNTPMATTATFVVNSADDHNDSVCNASDCTLREAIIAANGSPGTDAINFAIGSGAQTISPTSPLPTISGTVMIDGSTQPGFAGTPLIELDGTNSGLAANGLNIFASNCVIRGLIINRFALQGISIQGGNNTIAGNYIGTNAASSASVGNGENGIFISGTSNMVGGTATADRNIISGNLGSGILLFNVGATANQVLGNFIGTNVTGTSIVANMSDGISITSASGNTIGGAAPGAGNVISGTSNGVHIIDSVSTGNLITGNFIGTDFTGTTDLGNQFAGIDIFEGANTTIGGSGTGERNVISGNSEGIRLNNSASGNIVRGNLIGTKGDGATQLPNDFNGIRISFSAGNNTIGGTAAGQGNQIAFNRANGVFIDSNATGNSIQGNSIFSNDRLGINLFANTDPANGVTPNDAGDGDLGANNLQNFPVLTAASTVGGTINIQGSLNSNISTTFRVEFFYSAACDPAGNGEGQTFIGFTNVTTDGSGNAGFNSTFTAPVPSGSAVTATATSMTTPPNTSEFSPCVTSTGSSCTYTLSAPDASFSASAGMGSVNVTTVAGCAWTASTKTSWIEVTSGSSGNGNGTVTFTVENNPANTARSGTITIAGLTFTVLQGATFQDVPVGHPFYEFIGKLSARGVTTGCSLGNYCPEQVVTREQMAAFILRARGEFNPPTPPSQRFADVAPSNPFYNFIDRLAVLQITLGCGDGNYCPSSPVLREQMAAFIIRALHEPGYIPPTPGSQRFNDVPPSNPFYAHIEEMAVRNITLGCSATMYCPSDTVTRAQMAAFLVRAFNL